MSPGRGITCTHVLDLLDDYRRGKLLPGQQQAIADHLQRCPECQAELELREAMARQMVAALPAGELQTRLSPSVHAAITGATRGERERTQRKTSTLLPMMLTAAALIITVVAVFQVRNPLTLTKEATIAASAEKPVASEQRDSNLFIREDNMEAKKMDQPLAQTSIVRSEQAGALKDSISSDKKEVAAAEAPAVLPLAMPPPATAAPAEKEGIQGYGQPAVMSRRMSAASAGEPRGAALGMQDSAQMPAPEAPVAMDAASEAVFSVDAAPPAQAPVQNAQQQRTLAGAVAEQQKAAPEHRVRFHAKTATTATLSTSTLATTAPAQETTGTAVAPEGASY